MKRIICGFSFISLVSVLLFGIPKPLMAAQGTRPTHPKRIRMSQGVSNKLLISKVDPAYPDEARKKHVQGSVVLQILIGESGAVTDLRAVSGDALLVPSALEAVKKWVYRPYLLNGNAVEVETQVTINYTLHD